MSRCEVWELVAQDLTLEEFEEDEILTGPENVWVQLCGTQTMGDSEQDRQGIDSGAVLRCGQRPVLIRRSRNLRRIRSFLAQRTFGYRNCVV